MLFSLLAEIHCGVPDDVAHADKVYSEDTLDAAVTYQCVPTHRFIDGKENRTAYCTVTSTWEEVYDTCERGYGTKIQMLARNTI